MNSLIFTNSVKGVIIKNDEKMKARIIRYEDEFNMHIR